MYDFDKTLSTTDMQEYSFIPRVGESSEEFWAQADALSTKQNMDGILASMYLMLKKCNQKDMPITRKSFVDLGKDIKWHKGVKDWFGRINAYGREAGAVVEHYIISSGLKEVIEGTEIAHHFKKIYASEFHYNASGIATWPQTAINYTAKTQFLFRINKGILDISDDSLLNLGMAEEERRIPFSNMIYLGDGMTDVPCMKLVKEYGGHSIAVYPSKDANNSNVAELIRADRVNFATPTDYSEGGTLDKTVKAIIKKIVADQNLRNMRDKQFKKFD
ncbi:MAG: haloacid dehalogenase-like hydrolase [Clostridia bacterium]|nr:haloacid dehalogenase-like hydrolase [Clostridia bacterium]